MRRRALAGQSGSADAYERRARACPVPTVMRTCFPAVARWMAKTHEATPPAYPQAPNEVEM